MPFARPFFAACHFRSIVFPFIVAALLCSAACDGGTEGTGSGTGSEPEAEPTDPPEQAPTWTDAVDSLQLTQGQWARVDVTTTDPQEDTVTFNVDAGPLHLALGDNGSFSLRPGYDDDAPVDVEITLTDEAGNERSYVIAVEVTAFGWGETIEWSDANGPEPREHATALYDAASNAAFVFGGSGYSPYLGDLFDFWRFDVNTSTWREITPTGSPPAMGGSRRFAGLWGSGSGLLFGGYTEGAPPNADDLYAVTVENGTLHFEVLTQINPPPARALHAFAYDADTDRYVLFGGYSQNAGFTVYNDVWTMTVNGTNAEWTSHTVLGGPSNRYGMFTAVDEVEGHLFVFSGGQLPVSQADSVNAARDSWMLDMRADPPEWTMLDTSGAPGRRNGCAITDPNGRFFMLGGTADAMTTSAGVFALDMRQPHAGFESLPINDSPLTALPLRSSGFGFATLDKVYCGFGNTTQAVYQDWLVLSAQHQ